MLEKQLSCVCSCLRSAIALFALSCLAAGMTELTPGMSAQVEVLIGAVFMQTSGARFAVYGAKQVSCYGSIRTSLWVELSFAI